MFFLFFPEKQDLTLHANLLPILFSTKNKKDIVNLSSAELAQRVVKVNILKYFYHHCEDNNKSHDHHKDNKRSLISLFAFYLEHATHFNQLLSSALSSACDFKSHFCKQCGPRSDCSSRSSLIWVHTVCLYTKCKFEKFARRCSRRHKQTTFSDADFLGALRVKHSGMMIMDYLYHVFMS